MPTYEHAVVKRAKWFSPAAQQILLWIESIKQKRLTAAGSYYRAFPLIMRRHRASKMPTCGHAVVIRARWFSPAAQQILLWIESIKPKRLNTAGSYYRALPLIMRRHRASKMPACGHAVVKRARYFSPAAQQIPLWIELVSNRG
ncbi:hypothetical protein DC082_09095 [Ignatzschineria indica]|uniref:Uncharacterized protein n=2 Tax=Ignatzschineria indica TaxID=472583 RepID=A0A2U2AIF3_9GAMM|nr:hypothetical protein DC082_09095 [Ignatzschineria indica]